ncbi:uncharacterized protein LOC119099813 [Pollicipes pollicipes]|uniref:uncharacterized protein LOC119099813 n=1 Tax=Pollicipes pollicipes TaxID=41117 RepID=UPI001885601F|nr:uncharacterized protein LOC119099813 [Pollicipes pollicipes]XP_037078788.1 uncharacterized protein LOC119099813 [Pollicipes pollicipes]
MGVPRMQTCRLLTILWCLLMLTEAQVTDSLPKRLMSTAFFPLRHPQVGRTDWLAARDFSERYLRALGLNVTRQVFSTTVLFDQDIAQLVEGVNLLAVVPGRHWDSDAEDDILVVGAHYDTDVTNMGVRPGSGMVALLELGRHIQERRTTGLQLDHTVILAALDLMTSEHSWGKAGDSGAEVFLRGYLNPLLTSRPSRRFRGAIMLDSVFNFNASVGSQVYPGGFAETFPDVEQTGRGDFLGVVSRPASDAALLEALKAVWPAGAGRLQPLSLPQQPPDTEALFQFLSQGHDAFWNRAAGGVVSSLPAVLLTDTGRYRQLPRRCLSVDTICGPREMLTPERMRFFNQTVKALTDAVLTMQGSSSSSAVMGSWLLLLTGLLASCVSH